MTPCLQAVPSQSLFNPTPHVIVKYHISEMNIVDVMIILIHPLPIYLNLGTTITTNNLQSPTSRTTMTTPPTMTTAPPKSGSPGSLGKTSPSLNITHIPPDGSTIQSRITNINLMMNRLPQISLKTFDGILAGPALTQPWQSSQSLWFCSVPSFHSSTWSYCHQPSRRFQRGMGSSSQTCSHPSRSDESGK